MCTDDQQRCVWRSEEEEAAEAEVTKVAKLGAKAKPVPKGTVDSDTGRSTRAKAGSAAAPIELDSNKRVYSLSESETGAESDRPQKRTKSTCFLVPFSFVALLKVLF